MRRQRSDAAGGGVPGGGDPEGAEFAVAAGRLGRDAVVALRKSGELIVAGDVDRRARLAGSNSLHCRRYAPERRSQARTRDGGGEQSEERGPDDRPDQQRAHHLVVLVEAGGQDDPAEDGYGEDGRDQQPGREEHPEREAEAVWTGAGGGLLGRCRCLRPAV